MSEPTYEEAGVEPEPEAGNLQRTWTSMGDAIGGLTLDFFGGVIEHFLPF